MKAVNKIRADMSLLNLSNNDGGGYYRSVWEKYGNWWGYRCIQVFLSRGDGPIDRNNRNTWDTHNIYLQGYTPHTPIKHGTQIGPSGPIVPGSDPNGTWDIRSGTGEHYVLTLSRSGQTISGTIRTDAGASGAVSGRVLGTRMLMLDYNLPDRSSQVFLTVKDDTVQGPDKGTNKAWTGKRVP
jgi:hypothetical protein